MTEYKNRKFHLRVYVLAVGSLQVYVYEEILALFSLETYSDCSSFEMDIINMKSHITNTCVQLDSVESNEKRLEIENECVKKFWNLKLNDLNEKENSLKLNSIFSQIKQCVGELFECLYFEPTVFQLLNFMVLISY